MQKKLKGLTQDEVIDSRKKYGDNSLAKEKHKSFFKRFIENLNDPIIKVLIIAVIVEIIFTFGNIDPFETAGIIIAILIATTVSTVSEHGSQLAFQKMEEVSANTQSRVLREGTVLTVPTKDIVVGDYVFIDAGESVPADGIIIQGSIYVDQSSLNGESREVEKRQGDMSFSEDLSSEFSIFRGSLVTSGECLMRVERVGSSTFYGMVAKDVQKETRDSPLKKRLGNLASTISKLGYVMAIVVGLTYLFLTYVVDNSYNITAILSSLKNIPFVISTLSHALTLMITVIVVAVPEGLPMMITVVLSANMKKMIRDNVIVKKLVGIETAGSMNILFTDKTGTLTIGKTTVSEIIGVNSVYKTPQELKKSKFLYDSLCASAGIDGVEDLKTGGNSTDKAFLSFFEGCEAGSFKIGSRIPFTSEKKYSSVILDDGRRIVRGAPEIILSSCTGCYDSTGNILPINTNIIEKIYKSKARAGGRVVCVAIQQGSGDCNFLALVVLKDKIRKGTREAVAQVIKSGVRVVMITGDSPETAAVVAHECGILPTGINDGIITHNDLQKMSDMELKDIIPKLYVVARALPSDKTRLVRICQEMNLVVGMTGDGVNDAPSLKLADIGFAMGSGTDIAKAAGDIVIMDNSFFAISRTILYGRTIFKSIRKFISFQLMMNIAACGISLFGQFLGIENPITIIQMLWINIIMDTFGGLAFSGEPTLDYYMLEKPKTSAEKLLSKDMLHQIAFTGGYTLLLCIAFLYFDFFKSLFIQDSSDMHFLTAFYALFVFAGIFNCFNARSERLTLLSNIGKNKPFLLIMFLISAIQLLMIYFFGDIFRCVPLTFRELLSVILIGASVIPFDMIRKLLKKLG